MSEALKDRVRDYIEATDHVSFAELSNHFSDHFTGGEHALELCPNLVVWAGMTQEASDAMRELLNEDKAVFGKPCALLIYLIDGRSMSLPIAKRLKPYTKPHWLPMTLRPIKHLPVARRSAA
jgi:hypothetical protein